MSQLTKTEQKIMDNLTKEEIQTTELAELISINITNIGRYLKKLEKLGLIQIRTEQAGKVRYKFISLKEKKESKKQINKELDKLEEEIKKSQEEILDFVNSGLPKDTPEFLKFKHEDIIELNNEIKEEKSNIKPNNTPKHKNHSGSPSQINPSQIEIKNLDPEKIIKAIQNQNSLAYSNVTRQLKKYGKKIIVYELVTFINNNKEKFWQ